MLAVYIHTYKIHTHMFLYCDTFTIWLVVIECFDGLTNFVDKFCKFAIEGKFLNDLFKHFFCAFFWCDNCSGYRNGRKCAESGRPYLWPKIDHLAQKLKIEIIMLLYSAKRAEYADIFVFFFWLTSKKLWAVNFERFTKPLLRERPVKNWAIFPYTQSTHAFT